MTRPITSTYRLQLRGGLTLDDVVERGWLEHANQLGASHLYLSPVLTAVPGSTHGYDVVDPTRVDPALGGDEAFERLAVAAADAGLGLIVDIVPNHMAADHTSNPWWWDVLRNGGLSEFADVFDLDPVHPEQRLQGRIFLPVLGDHYGRVLDAGRLVLRRRELDVVVSVDDRPFPLEPSTLGELLAPAAAELGDDLLWLVATSYRRVDRDDPAARAAELRVLDGQLAQQLRRGDVAERIDHELDRVNGDVDVLHDLLERQPYRLAHWRAARDLGYRRFFDVNDLIGVRVEEPAVFELTHRTVRDWVDRGLVDGLRIDHPDGLADPAGYLHRLRSVAPDTWIVVEKILERDEQLPGDWPVEGTTGYEVAELIARWQLDPDGLARLGALRDELVGASPGGHELVADCKRLVLAEVLPADLNRATESFLRMCESLRRFRDVTRHELHELLRELAIAYPVYRSYVRVGEPASERDLGIIGATLGAVAEANPEFDAEVIDLLGSALTGRLDGTVADAVELRTRVQQLTGPAMAKGKEDTAFYRDVRLVSRNEVGADPFAGVAEPAEVHDVLGRLARSHPMTMTSLSTHDSKRSEDVRARLGVLTGVADDWSALLRMGLAHADRIDPDRVVDPATRSLLVQTLVGVHPVSLDRLSEYLLKAVREAKVHTSWLRPDATYEGAVETLAAGLVDDEELSAAVASFVDDLLSGPATTTSIVQKVLQLTTVGVPDVYWGTEDQHLRLVDPDNRVAPDLDHLRAVGAGSPPPAGGSGPGAKAHAVRSVLALRARRPDCFGADAGYRPLEVDGEDADRVLAFARGAVAVVATRWPWRGPLDPATTVHLPAPGPTMVLGGDAPSADRVEVAVAGVVGDWGVAVLEGS